MLKYNFTHYLAAAWLQEESAVSDITNQPPELLVPRLPAVLTHLLINGFNLGLSATWPIHGMLYENHERVAAAVASSLMAAPKWFDNVYWDLLLPGLTDDQITVKAEVEALQYLHQGLNNAFGLYLESHPFDFMRKLAARAATEEKFLEKYKYEATEDQDAGENSSAAEGEGTDVGADFRFIDDAENDKTDGPRNGNLDE